MRKIDGMGVNKIKTNPEFQENLAEIKADINDFTQS